jgi:ABC-type sugar transport system permease subunit
MYLFDQAFTYNHMGYASAMAWVQLLMILGLTGLAFWTSKRWVHY